MSERYAASIRIGGEIKQPDLARLLDAITKASVFCHWGEPPFEPKSAEELAVAVRDGHLFLCDEQTRDGEFPELETACRELGLSYTRWSEGFCSYDAEVVEWRPCMNEPAAFVGSNAGDATFVPADEVRKALKHLESNHIGRARELLRKLCPDIPKLPPFTIV